MFVIDDIIMAEAAAALAPEMVAALGAGEAAAGAGAGAAALGAGAGAGAGAALGATMAPSQPGAAVAGVQLASRQHSSLVPFFQTSSPVPLRQLSMVVLATPNSRASSERFRSRPKMRDSRGICA